MGANKVSTIGGGAATGTANSWNQFLGQQLGQTPQSQQNSTELQALQQMMSLPGANKAQIQNRISQLSAQSQASNGAAPPSMFQNLFNNAANGQVQDQSGSYGALQGMIQGGPGQMTAQQYSNPYQNQQFQGPNLSQLPTDLFAGQNGMANLGQVGSVGPTNFNVMQGYGGQPATSQYDGGLSALLSQLGMGGSGQVGANTTSLDPAKQIDTNDPYVAAQQQGLQRQKEIDAANLRARFGAQGAGALGTGAQFAEGNLRAAYAPQEASILQDAIRFGTQQDLAERQAKAGVGLQSNAQALQAAMASAQNGMQGQNMALSGLLQGRGQDLNQLLANRGMDINQLGLGLNQAQGNQQAGIQQRGQDLSSLLQNQQQGNQFGFNAAAQNSQNQQNNNLNGLNLSQLMNNFNLNNAGQNAQYGQATNALNSNNFNQGQNNWLQALGLGNQQNALGNSNQQNLLQQLFGAFGQSNGLGTPQAQTSVQPSAGSQWAQGLLGLGGAALGGPLGGMIGNKLGGMFGGGGMPAPTNLPGLGSPTPNNFNWQSLIGMTPSSSGSGGGWQMPTLYTGF
jgi:hypothetical protein